MHWYSQRAAGWWNRGSTGVGEWTCEGKLKPVGGVLFRLSSKRTQTTAWPTDGARHGRGIGVGATDSARYLTEHV
ncbi:MAG: hypothetical protein HFH23_16085 [Ruminococcus sp.]|nr:hypothetical protein [Ruminococcus sp.]